MGKREDILSATKDLIVEQGIESLSFSKIFAKAGVGSGTVYNYFASKEELIVEVYREISAHLSQEVMTDYDPAAGIRERFTLLLKNLARFVSNYRKELAVQSALAHSPIIPVELKLMGTPSADAAMALFKEGQASGVLERMNPLLAFGMVSSALIGAVSGAMVGKYGADDRILEQAVEACWRMIAVEPAGFSDKVSEGGGNAGN